MRKIYFCFVCLVVLGVNNIFAQVGSTCANPDIISTLPYNVTALNTTSTADNYDVTPCADATAMAGNDYVFSYTPLVNEVVNISLANVPTLITAGIFVTDLCPDSPTAICVGHAIGSMIAAPVLIDLNLTAGVQYFIVVSSAVNFLGQGQTMTFDISMQACGSAPVAVFSLVESDTIVTFTNTSTDAVNYQWLFGDEPISNWFLATNDTNPVHAYPGYGTYLVQMVATNSCGSTDTVSQTITLVCPGTIPAANFTYSDLGAGAFQFTSTSTDAVSYEWYMDYAPGLFFPAQYTTANTNHSFMADGTYTVYLVVNNPCGSDTATVTINVTGVLYANALNQDQGIKCFPNPVQNIVTVELTNMVTGTQISMENILGTELSNEVLETSGFIRKHIDITNLSKGIYFLEVKGNNGTKVIRIIKE